MKDFRLSIPVEKAPHYRKKRIVWNKNGDGGTAVILVGYCPDTLSYFLGLAQEILKDFPDAEVGQATCAKVNKSEYVYGHTVFLCPVKGQKREVSGYDEYQSIDFNY